MTDPTHPDPVDAAQQPKSDLPIAGQSSAASSGEASASENDASAEGQQGDDSNHLLDALKQVIDPELMINIVDLGLVYEVEQTDATVNVDMTLTSPACPAGPQIMQQAKMALERLDDVSEAKIQLVMSPPWSPDRMTDDARDQLGIF